MSCIAFSKLKSQYQEDSIMSFILVRNADRNVIFSRMVAMSAIFGYKYACA